MIYLITGSERLLMDQKLKALQDKLKCNKDNMNYSVYDLNYDSMEEAYQDVITMPFLTENKMIVIQNPTFLYNVKEKKNDTNEEDFNKCLEEINDNIELVIFNYNQKLDNRKKAVKTLLKVAKSFTFETLSESKLSDSTRKAIRERGASIEDDALDLLLQRVSNNLLDVQNEINKLCLYTKEIKYDDVYNLVSIPLDENVYDLTNALLVKNREKMFLVYKSLMVLKVEPIRILFSIADSLRLKYQVKVLSDKGYNQQEIAKMFHKNPNQIYYVLKDINQFDKDELLKYLDELSKLNVQMVTGKVNPKIGLELFLMEI